MLHIVACWPGADQGSPFESLFINDMIGNSTKLRVQGKYNLPLSIGPKNETL